MKRWRAIALAAGLTGGAVVATSSPASADGSGKTLADVLLADSARDNPDGFDRRWFDYDIVTQAVLLFPDLVAAASDPNAELTAFLPNDYAFRKLIADLTGTWPRKEADVFAAVAGLGTDTVKTVLTYHLVAGPPISYRTALGADGAALTTLQGGAITVDVVNFFGFKIVAHGIEAVLRPVDL